MTLHEEAREVAREHMHRARDLFAQAERLSDRDETDSAAALESDAQFHVHTANVLYTLIEQEEESK